MKRTKGPWFDFRNADGGAAEIWLYAEIGEDFWGDGSSVPARDFVAQLNAITAPQIDLHIHSRGGAIGDGQAMFTALRRHPANVTSYIDGYALSMAGVVAVAADKVIMAANATFMVHKPWGMMVGQFTAGELRKQADALDVVEQGILGIYAAKTGRPEADIQAEFEAESWYTAERALELGYIDEIGGELDLGSDAARDLAACGFRCVPERFLVPTPEAAAAPQDEPEAGDGDEPPTMNPRVFDLLAIRRHEAPKEE
jgi:ATP-dependent Clp protease protease subunit